MDHLTPELLRMFERQLIVVGGILAIYLGYRLLLRQNVVAPIQAPVNRRLLLIDSGA